MRAGISAPVQSRLKAGRSLFGAIAAVIALCAGVATLALSRRAVAPIQVPPPERQLKLLADRTPPRGGPLRDRQQTERGSSADPLTAALERGVAAYNSDDTDEAVDAFEEAVRLAPEEPEAHINLGLVYLRLQRTEDAMRELTTGASLAHSRRER